MFGSSWNESTSLCGLGVTGDVAAVDTHPEERRRGIRVARQTSCSARAGGVATRSVNGNILIEAHAKDGDLHRLHGIGAVVHNRVTAPDYGFVGTQGLAQET